MNVMQGSVGFVAPDDMERLTGYAATERKRQCKWLDEHGFVYTVNARDEPVLLWEHLREKLCLRTATHAEAPQLDFGAVPGGRRRKREAA